MKGITKILGGLFIVLVAILYVPNNIKAAEMSDEFKTYLNEKGELEIKSIVPTNEEFLAGVIDLFTYRDNEWLGLSFSDFKDDYSETNFIINGDDEVNKESHPVKIKWVYDPKIKLQVDKYMSKLPENLTTFEVRDLELVNYWLNGYANGESLTYYSSHLKSYFDYTNFKMDFKGGGHDKFELEGIGNGTIMYNDSIYGLIPHAKIEAKSIIYIDESVGDTEEEIIAAVQKRIDDYVGEGKVTVELAGESIYDLYNDEFDFNISYNEEQLEFWTKEYEKYSEQYQTNCVDNPVTDIDACNQYKTERDNASKELSDNNYPDKIDMEKYYKESFIERWNDGSYDYLKDAVNDWYFSAHMQFGDLMYSPYFIVVKDSSKMINPSVKTADINTDIEISTDAKLPLDTTIEASELTKGTEYERIVKLLNLTDNLMFDLKLYSSSLDDYITELDNGEFEVKIPVPDEFKGKTLSVYYVDENDEIHDYDVEPEGDYIKFKTTHFSIYTLGYKETSVPKTSDGILVSIIIAAFSLIGLIGTKLLLKKSSLR